MVYKNIKKMTTIIITKKLLNKLKLNKVHKNQSYSELIDYLLESRKEQLR